MPWKKRPRTLRRRAIRRRTGAKAQSKQIVALAAQVSNLTKSQYETISTVWNRQDLSVDSLVGGTTAYICPLPKAMMNCFGQDTVQNNALVEKRIPWSDNLSIAAQAVYYKTPLFGSSQAARRSPEATHLGGRLQWRLICQEPSFSTYSVFVVSPKKKQADQLITDRNLKGTSAAGEAGGGGNMNEGTDFISHPDLFGTMFNRKYWNVDYSREVNFSHPVSGAAGTIQTNVNPSNTDPKNNSVIATGSVKLKAGGVIRCFNNQTLTTSPATGGSKSISASQIGYLDEQNEKTQFLVIVNNGVSADLETVNLSLLCKDYYKVAV